MPEWQITAVAVSGRNAIARAKQPEVLFDAVAVSGRLIHLPAPPY